jgi:hypothetical protein
MNDLNPWLRNGIKSEFHRWLTNQAIKLWRCILGRQYFKVFHLHSYTNDNITWAIFHSKFSIYSYTNYHIFPQVLITNAGFCLGLLILTLQAIFTRLASFNALTKSGPIQDVSISCSWLSVSMLQYSLHNRRQPYICIIVQDKLDNSRS